MVKINILDGDKESVTRPLWEAVFLEDSSPFLDYYYKEKASTSIVFTAVKDGSVVSMLHLNPYKAFLPAIDREIDVFYIVAVATLPQYRKQGLMSTLIKSALNYIREQGHPFTFLMPASEKIYRPFQFRYIYDRPIFEWREEMSLEANKETKNISVNTCLENGSREIFLSNGLKAVRAGAESFEKLSAFMRDCLHTRHNLYMSRSVPYLTRRETELNSTGGGIYMINRINSDEDISDTDKLVGYFLWERGGMFPIAEALFDDNTGDSPIYVADKKPIIMARVTETKSLLSMLRAKREISLTIEVIDPLLPDNSGVFLWRLNEHGASAEKAEGNADITIDVNSLIEFCFGKISIETCFKGAEEENLQKLNDICLINNPFINELV